MTRARGILLVAAAVATGVLLQRLSTTWSLVGVAIIGGLVVIALAAAAALLASVPRPRLAVHPNLAPSRPTGMRRSQARQTTPWVRKAGKISASMTRPSATVGSRASAMAVAATPAMNTSAANVFTRRA